MEMENNLKTVNKKIMIFSGTTEGKNLALELAKYGIYSDVSVATEYGKNVMPESKYIELMVGRLNEQEISEKIANDEYALVVDATHPYASEVTENIRQACYEKEKRYLRLLRDKEARKTDMTSKEKITYVASARECADALSKTFGNILLTTGSKELNIFADEDLRNRLYVRVLPSVDSIKICEENGINSKHIIAMQGPFTEKLNAEIMRQFDIDILVTKDSGKNGGFEEKIDAAEYVGAKVFVIGKPKENVEESDIYSYDEVLREIKSEFSVEDVAATVNLNINLIGMGMGDKADLTLEACECIEGADIIYGAKRLLESVSDDKLKKPYYLANDIIPDIRDFAATASKDLIKVAVLFSGDTGFYSGATKLYEELKKVYPDEDIRIMPGISSMSSLAAKGGITYQDASIKSLHGKEENYIGEVIKSVLNNHKTYILTSGKNQLTEFLSKLKKDVLLKGLDLSKFMLIVGYQLSYAEEQICTGDIDQVLQKLESEAEGLYSLFVINDSEKSDKGEKNLIPYLEDDIFIRDKVPMTKSAIRHLSIGRLGLKNDSVLYDIGSGTGSISCEAAALSDSIKVYAIEAKNEAAELTRKNAEKLKLDNVTVVEGMAPQAFAGLKKASHAFIGGSRGRLCDIISTLYDINPDMRVVVNAVSLETIAELSNLESVSNVKITDFRQEFVSVTEVKKLGVHNMLSANNPICICSFTFGK